MKPADRSDALSGSLPPHAQDTIAAATLIKLKNRARLERLAQGSITIKLGWALPIVVAVALLWIKPDLSFLVPFLVPFLLIMIQAQATYTHARIDAIYQLMNKAELDK